MKSLAICLVIVVVINTCYSAEFKEYKRKNDVLNQVAELLNNYNSKRGIHTGGDNQCVRGHADFWACEDGDCIHKTKRCNDRVDCRFGEDERKCPPKPKE